MKRLLFLLLALTMLFSQTVFASEKNYVYRETTGKTSINSEWTIKPSAAGYSVVAHYKLVAIKQKTEQITVNGQDVEAAQVKVTMPGIASLFWSTKYWYRKSDGLYIRFFTHI